MELLMETLISAVREQPCLWNPLHSEYRDPGRKEVAWSTIVDAVNDKAIPNVKVAKIEWRRLRDNHRDALKRAKLGKNKLLPAHITTWKYAKAMQFLEPYMKYRITENIEIETQNVKNINTEQDVSTTETENIHIGQKRPKLVEVPSTSQMKHDSVMKTQPDALSAFFNCIHQTTREMPQWMQTNVKKKIFAVMIEAEELLVRDDHRGNETNSLGYFISNDININVKQETDADADDESIY